MSSEQYGHLQMRLQMWAQMRTLDGHTQGTWQRFK